MYFKVIGNILLGTVDLLQEARADKYSHTGRLMGCCGNVMEAQVLCLVLADCRSSTRVLVQMALPVVALNLPPLLNLRLSFDHWLHWQLVW